VKELQSAFANLALINTKVLVNSHETDGDKTKKHDMGKLLFL
jgi:hypothetical protein